MIVQTRFNKTTLGVMLILITVFMMSVQEALFKYFCTDRSMWQIFTLRGLLAIPLLFIIAFVQNQKHNLWSYALRKWSLLRSLFLTLMVVTIYAAMPFINLSTIAAGIYTGPVFVTILSAFIIGEPVGGRGWFAIGMGFCGVLVILQPGTEAFSYWTLLPVLGGFLYALSNITTCSKCQTIPVSALALSLNMALLLTGVMLSGAILFWHPVDEMIISSPYLFGGWSNMGSSEWFIIVLLAVLVVGIGMTLAGAYQAAPPSIVATFDYSYLIFVALWDYLFFSNIPSTMTALGILLIICAGLMVIRRNEQVG